MTQIIFTWKGLLDISVSVSWHQHRNRHQHCKNLIFVLRTCFGKNRTFMSNTSKYFFTYAKLFRIYNFLVIYPKKDVHCVLQKILFEFSEVFRESSCYKIFWKSPNKTSMMESFLRTLAGLSRKFPKVCLRQLFCTELAGASFRKKGFWKFKNTRDKAVVYRPAIF